MFINHNIYKDNKNKKWVPQMISSVQLVAYLQMLNVSPLSANGYREQNLYLQTMAENNGQMRTMEQCKTPSGSGTLWNQMEDGIIRRGVSIFANNV